LINNYLLSPKKNTSAGLGRGALLFAYSLEQRPESLFITEPAGKEIVDVSFFIQNGNYNTVIVMRDGRVRKEITEGENGQIGRLNQGAESFKIVLQQEMRIGDFIDAQLIP